MVKLCTETDFRAGRYPCRIIHRKEYSEGAKNMNEKAYSYMDWPRIEAIVYAEEASPKDVMSPRLHRMEYLSRAFSRGQRKPPFLLEIKNILWNKRMRQDILLQ